MWQKPKPPLPPLPEPDLLTLRISRILYEGVRESCDGYVEGYEQDGDTDPSGEAVDGRVDFPMFAKYIIDQLELKGRRMDDNTHSELMEILVQSDAIIPPAGQPDEWTDEEAGGYVRGIADAIERGLAARGWYIVTNSSITFKRENNE
jgi:hypothetical protein